MNQADFIEEENHPPIPPNCPYFTNMGFFRIVDIPSGVVLKSIIIADSTWRPIIAAVAEVAWLKEARRLSALRKEQKDKPVSERPNYTSPMLDAVMNADLWRIWGEKK